MNLIIRTAPPDMSPDELARKRKIAQAAIAERQPRRHYDEETGPIYVTDRLLRKLGNKMGGRQAALRHLFKLGHAVFIEYMQLAQFGQIEILRPCPMHFVNMAQPEGCRGGDVYVDDVEWLPYE
jgi:hypothetical protein